MTISFNLWNVARLFIVLSFAIIAGVAIADGEWVGLWLAFCSVAFLGLLIADAKAGRC